MDFFQNFVFATCLGFFEILGSQSQKTQSQKKPGIFHFGFFLGLIDISLYFQKVFDPIKGAVSKLADNVPAGRTRRSLSISSGADDWFSVKSFEDSDEEPDADECDPTLLKEIDTIHYRNS